MTVGEWRGLARRRLLAAGQADARKDPRLLAAIALGLSPGEVPFADGRALQTGELSRLEAMLSRREAGEPLQYIEGAAYFMRLKLRSDARALIPRPDTETLCEAALEKMRGLRAPRVLDLCTGSGALAIAIGRARPDAAVTATDISARALSLAQENALACGASVRFLRGDALSPVAGERFQIIVCNPPYLTRADMENLQTEVRREPALALYGGEDGLALYERIALGLGAHMERGAYALFEVGMGQARRVRALLEKGVPRAQSGIIKDICGIDRVVYVRSE